MRPVFGIARTLFVCVLLGTFLTAQVSGQTNASTPATLIDAILRSNVKIVIGPDRYPYLLAFRGADANVPDAKVYLMAALAKIALADHCGIAVYERSTAEPKALWVFTLGDVVLLSQGKWRPVDPNPAPTPGPGGKLTFGTPSLEMLPLELRRSLTAFMHYDHIATPKIVMVIARTSSGAYRTPYMVIPNVPEQTYPTPDAWKAELHRIQWFIPPSFDIMQPPIDPKVFDLLFRGVEPLDAVIATATPVPAHTAASAVLPATIPESDAPAHLVRDAVRSDAKIVRFPNGFPYVAAVVTNEAVDNKLVYSMAALAQIAVAKGAGIVVYDPAISNDKPVWGFPLGAVTLIARNIWVPRVSGPPPVALPGEHLVARTPTRDELPLELRNAIDQYMRTADGIETPKIALLTIVSASGGSSSPTMMMPNLPSTGFADSASWLRALNQIEWFVPGNELFVQPPVDPAAFTALFHDVAPVRN